ncbi:hypothetical protein COV19_06515 [Candidatus Woesearchaeota archaeon CG10_big_fil_rev_8_21_14_0_10_44_13]|nr:MAG: hypothetical protein COV19_06515 [Candidatus Woesearchaeota archaeon CG10_big_fil_rev_8_21_14_0_10_44_13]
MLEKYALWKVIEVLVKGEEEYSVRQMSRTAGIGAGTAKACLDYMHENGIIKKKVIGNIYQYSLDLANPAARQIKNAYFAKELLQKAGPKTWICSNEKEVVVVTTMESLKIEGIRIIKTNEHDFESLKKSYLDIITIR